MPLRINVRMLLTAGLIVLLTAGSLLFVAVRSAAAGTPVDKKLSFTCPFPLIGLQKLDVNIKADFEVPTAPGGTLTTSGLTITVTVPDKAARGLNLVGATTIEGTAAAGVTLVNGDANPFPVRIPLNVAKTNVPPSGTFSPVATGSVPTVTLAKPGKTTLTVGDFTTRLTPKKADGSFTGLGSFTSDCTLDPGQDAVLLSFDLGDKPAGHRYTVAGKTGVKALGATAPLTGAFDLSPTAATVFSGGPVFDKAHTEFRLFGFVPGTADLEFVADGPQGGDLAGTGFVARPRFTTVLPLVTLVGMPVSSGPGCKTSAPSTAELRTGDGFTMAAGGTLTGTYALAPLTGCGAFTPYLSTFVQGDGNTFDLALTPRKA
ncbi:DUF6801 domain-containing protein [Amycolatopsis azurea]|uniref:DUF6801 domain-containing protein n=1 Tax=Amycolatopsis azurea DSM 43854 TaxID=1238180 RepID=M2PS16_9PSEU|nr:DUF6801 domain-containing protein [Amycolatopsis azurea]EMD22325.1 hypothetical protein C791_8510 [Amycolatopsis azurea DSM 43854]OOC01258.1 hypothetical protein B0293_39060 [Amycolatopsis azurea DSM 43854]